jgi:RimJ/RimL family protein N-acetyltransferase
MDTLNTFPTDRLLATRLLPGDLGELCRMHQDPQVMTPLGGLRSDEETRRWLGTNLDHWGRHGFGLWMFRDRSDGRFVGRGGLRHVEVEGRDEVEVAYALRAEFWGQGLATEIARASVWVAFEQLGLPDVIAFTLPANRASQRVMEKAGFTYERDVAHAGMPHVLYRITATTTEHTDS